MDRPYVKSVLMALVFLMVQVSWGATFLYVDDDAPPGGDGQSW